MQPLVTYLNMNVTLENSTGAVKDGGMLTLEEGSGGESETPTQPAFLIDVETLDVSDLDW